MPKKRLKIFFCTPPSQKKADTLEMFSEGGSSFPSTGLLILASVAREYNHNVIFKDFLNSGEDMQKAIEIILEHSPDWVGISSNTDMIFQASTLASRLKKYRRSTRVLIGGPHISCLPVETMERCEGFDIGFIGEAEQTFSELLRSDLSPGMLKNIRGICYRDDCNIVLNERQPFINDIDSLPFPSWDLIDDMRLYRPAVTNFRQKPVFPIITSRGCFGRCIFCDRGVFGNRVRMHSAKYVMGMIQELRARYGIREITFYDDTLAVDKERLKELCGLISREGKSLSWSCSARVDQVDEHTLFMMRRAGCWQINYGIESGSENILKTLKKGITIEGIRDTARLMKKTGMSMRGYFIIGSPGETEATLNESLDLILSLPMNDILVEYMTPYPGSELYGHVGEYGRMLGDWSTLNSYDMNFIPNGMSEDILRKYFLRFYKSFYLRPRVVFNYAMRIKNPFKIADLGMKYLRFSSAHKG